MRCTMGLLKLVIVDDEPILLDAGSREVCFSSGTLV